MSRVAAIGADVWLAGYALAGVEVLAADDAAAAIAAWERLPDDTACLILTAGARAAIGPRLAQRPRLVWAVVPG